MWDRSAGRELAARRGMKVTEGLRARARATHSSSIDELNGRRARCRSEPREPPLKSESLQKDRRSVRYNRLAEGASRAERISPLSAGEACRSALRSEDRRASNSGLRGHCRAAGEPIAGAR